jgi:phosphoglycolate phosphatase
LYKLVIFDFDGTLTEGGASQKGESALIQKQFRLVRPGKCDPSLQLIPGAKALLRRLAGQGVVLGVVSEMPAAEVRRILGPEAAALVEHYECGPAFFGGPAARFRKIVKRARVTCEQTLCIGHACRAIQAAKAVGLACGGAAWAAAAREILASRRPTWMFETPDEVAERLAA